ncbi:MAG: hypothetical protein FWG85_04030 [Bacteroidetes bacterium]|nr:hypothetical protein [Bacteroidota bacterium]
MVISKYLKNGTLAILLCATLFCVGCTYNESPTYSTTYSDTYRLSIWRNDWQSDGEAGHWFKRFSIPNITKDIVDNGLVLVYYKNSLNNWIQLPYSTTLYNNYGIQFAEEMWFGYAIGTLDIDYVYTNPADMTPPQLLEIKVILLRL